MSSQPEVKVGEWIYVSGSVPGLVMGVCPEFLAVGYYQNQAKAVKEDVVWRNDRWEFRTSGPDASYLRGAAEAEVKRGPPPRS